MAAALALTTAACSSTGTGSSDSGKVTLTFWGGANTDKVIAVWNKSHPNIQVKTDIVQGGDPLTTKLLTAIKAGSGAPDVVGMEYSTIPTLVAAGALTDLSKYGASSLKSDFTQSTWNSVTLGGNSVWGLPTDAGPMMFYYRKDIFDSLGLTAPKTWDDYAADAKAVHAANPKAYLGTFDSTQTAWFAALTQQAGASWWGSNGKAWSVDIDSAASQKVATYWGDLVASGDIDTTPMFSPAWNASLNDGTQVGWTTAVWGPGVLAGNAPDTKGKWAAALLPQWKAGDTANGSWGGGPQVVTSQTKHPKESAELVKWLTSSSAGINAFVKYVGIYPAAVNSYGALASPPAFLSEQTDFYSLAATASKEVKLVTFGPNVNVAYSAYSDEFGKAAESKNPADFLAALTAMQTTTKADLIKSGYTVK